ncbi:hypothetical protein [Staphylococcus equorum]|mgnify:CR=1 FL=1|uniref:hypothetical protein n=1 Tax=Staphylococcus equorum TaxID=246432 RepID=UPI000852FC65|nr:hypothetical protein [Staphylococcus equorum]MDW3953372.1 hypothetical protein [Staphylococcus saprophyticus]MDW4023668.1 hypothetical protein [Staphylococcus saprophyticus]OEK60626.1 hypothetical protein ASS99_11225 [Staphylococcus equorum]
MAIKLATDIAKDIRQGLKKDLGLNRNHVSVKTYGNEMVVVEIKKEDVDEKEVQQYASQFEEIERDERTYEILCGGNTFVHVERAD